MPYLGFCNVFLYVLILCLRFNNVHSYLLKGFAMSVACREGLKIPPQAMEQIIVGANQDIRQVRFLCVLKILQLFRQSKSIIFLANIMYNRTKETL